MPFSVRFAYTHKLSLLALAAALTACGGGGGGSTTGGSTGGTTGGTTPTTPGNLSTTIEPTTYAAGSAELALYTELNQVRLAGGFGTVKQDPAIDVASNNHAKYIMTNYWNITGSGALHPVLSMYDIDPTTGAMMAHSEQPTWAGFTGILPRDRITAAGGQQYAAGEVISFPYPSFNSCVGDLLNTVFHRSGLLNTSTQFVGFGLQQHPRDQWGKVCVVEYGFKAPGNVRPSNWMGIYPGQGQTNVPVRMLLGEAPDPAPDIPFASKGSPVTIYLPSAVGLVTSFTLTANGSTTPVPVKQITYSDFPGYLTRSEVHILPRQHLAKGTVYNVSFKGTLANGTAVAKDWSFTTTVN